MRTRSIQRAFLGGLLCLAVGAQAQTSYRVGAMVPDASMYALNNTGAMVGETKFGQEGALLYENGVLTDLTPRGPGAGAAYGINHAGAVVGIASMRYKQRRAFIYQGGTMRALDPVVLGLSEAYDINDIGQVVGWGLGRTGQIRAFVYEGGSAHFLPGFPGAGGTRASGINNLGQIVGSAAVPDGLPGPDPERAFLYENGRMRLLQIRAYYSWARDINDAGYIVGGASTGGTTFGYVHRNGRTTAIGNFGGGRSGAEGINNRGQVVGFADDGAGNPQGFLYENGVLTNLSTVTPGWSISWAYDINDQQQIVATGCRVADGACFAVRLDPVPAGAGPGG